jgi:hypothetical protein
MRQLSASMILLFSSLLMAQDVGHRQKAPSTQEIRAATKEAEYAFRRFDELVSDLDYSLLAVGIRERVRGMVPKEQEEIAGARKVIADFERSPDSTLAADLLMIYGAVDSIDGFVPILSSTPNTDDVAKATATVAQAERISHASLAIEKGKNNVFAVFAQQVLADELELGKCRLRRPPK